MQETRGIARISYADWMEDSNDFTEESGEEYIEEKHRKGTKNSGPSLPKSSAERAKQIIYKNGQLSSLVKKGDPRCFVDPIGNECRFVPLDVIKENLNDISHVFKEGETGINTVIPNYKQADDILTNFGFTDNKAQFSLKRISEMALTDLQMELDKVEEELSSMKQDDELAHDFIFVPPYDEDISESISICANVMNLDWEQLGSKVQFDVIILDPPWPIQDSSVTRGVNLGYTLMEMEEIKAMPLHLVQKNGYIIIWVVASKLIDGIDMIENWGYEVVTFGNWIKTSVYGRYKPSNGYFLQHDKETYIVAKKGKPIDEFNPLMFQDSICSERGRQSHKPPQLYEVIEKMFPNRLYLEIFARAHNLRQNWVSLGLEVPE